MRPLHTFLVLFILISPTGSGALRQLQAQGSPAAQRFEQSLEHWFADTERFARQLHEVSQDDYMTMKRGQYLRQQAVF